METATKVAKNQVRPLIADPGLDVSVSRLTQNRIDGVVKRILTAETGARLQAYAETCVRCGLCAESCHFYLSHDHDPNMTPVAKVKQTIWEILRLKGHIGPDLVRRMAQIAYTECNLCRRCVMYCPFGIDTAYLMQTVRRLCHLLGVTPTYIQDTAHSHSATMNQMWVKDDEWIDSLMWQEDEAREEIQGLRIPLEKEGADIMYSVIAPEPKFRTQLIYYAAVILNETGMDWTMPATPGWDNSDMAMFTGDFELMGRLKRLHFETAQRLRVNRVVMGECGHAYRSVYDVGNRWLGWREHPIPVIHAVQFYWELLDSGRLKIAKKFAEPVTLQDPCNISRGRGLHDKAREVLKALCSEFVEMHPNREHNYCCAAGGGVINCGPPFKKARVAGNKIKADQLKATGVKIILAPCHNCHGGLEDIIKGYDLGMETKFFSEIIYECMEKPHAV